MGMVVVRAAAVGFLAEHTVAARLWGLGVGEGRERAPWPHGGVVCARLFWRACTPPVGGWKKPNLPNCSKALNLLS